VGRNSANMEISSKVVVARRRNRNRTPETRAGSGGLVSPHLITRIRTRAVGAAARKAERAVDSRPFPQSP
jgi:hypothetical protein